MPATPMAMLTMPLRQGRPNESVMIDRESARTVARLAPRSAAAEASGSTGSRQTSSPPETFEASTPALAQTKPCAVSR